MKSNKNRKIKKVLIVDDDEQFLKLSSLFLKKIYNVKVSTCETGKDALDKVCNDPNYDIIFLDINMPDMSGIDIYKAIEKNHSHLKSRIIFISAAVLDAKTKKYVEEINGKILERPFDLNDLGKMIEDH